METYSRYRNMSDVDPGPQPGVGKFYDFVIGKFREFLDQKIVKSPNRSIYKHPAKGGRI